MAEQEEVKDAPLESQRGAAEEPEAPDCQHCAGGGAAGIARFDDMENVIRASFVLIM